jgi:hypothetical protein
MHAILAAVATRTALSLQDPRKDETMRFIRRLMFLALLAGAVTTVMRRIRGGGECGPACDCSLGAGSCTCGHVTCLAPAQA